MDSMQLLIADLDYLRRWFLQSEEIGEKRFEFFMNSFTVRYLLKSSLRNLAGTRLSFTSMQKMLQNRISSITSRELIFTINDDCSQA